MRSITRGALPAPATSLSSLLGILSTLIRIILRLIGLLPSTDGLTP